MQRDRQEKFVKISEVFQTVQGEGAFTGTPSIFVRLQGCPVGCGWCDTKQTWETADVDKSSAQDDAAAIDAANVSLPTWANVSWPGLVQYMKDRFHPAIRHIVITGGEPLADPDLPLLVDYLVVAGYNIQIETSGTFPGVPQCAKSGAWVTCSPKIGMPGGLKVRQDAVTHASEIKYPVGKQADIDRLLELLEMYQPPPTTDVWIQPLSISKKATALCVNTAMERGWRVSIQTHKYIGIP